jgi:egghead protein (zeste-white 4 protein)
VTLVELVFDGSDSVGMTAHVSALANHGIIDLDALHELSRHRALAKNHGIDLEDMRGLLPLMQPAPVLDREVTATRARRTDWSFGFITGHRALVVIWIATLTLALNILHMELWRRSYQPHGIWEISWSWTSIIWAVAIGPVLFGTIGLLRYRHPDNLEDVQPIDKLVALRIVSRGSNVDALVANIGRCQFEMRRTPLFRYVIEVVVDEMYKDNGKKVYFDMSRMPKGRSISYIVVPDDYRTPNGSMFKARALQYALEKSPLGDNDWVVHLDEETQLTRSGIQGICLLISEEDDKELPCVGQGAILYHRKWREHPILTLADCVRTGDDFGRFFFQHSLGKTVFGLHGSYIVVRNDIEQQAGFDFGIQGSITEDAFWALVLMVLGVRTRWCYGYMEEQSTLSALDFVKQRQRWWQGLVLVSKHAPVGLRWRFCLGLNTLIWTLAPFTALYTMAHFIYGFSVPIVITWLANIAFAYFITLYVVGLRANMRESNDIGNSCASRFLWTCALMVLMPFFIAMEAFGVLRGIILPVSGFAVVHK